MQLLANNVSKCTRCPSARVITTGLKQNKTTILFGLPLWLPRLRWIWLDIAVGLNGFLFSLPRWGVGLHNVALTTIKLVPLGVGEDMFRKSVLPAKP